MVSKAINRHPQYIGMQFAHYYQEQEELVLASKVAKRVSTDFSKAN